MNELFRNKPCLIIPQINKNQVLAAETIAPTSSGLIILTLLLIHRGQVRANLLEHEPKFIQQLPSIKWNAKQIAKNPVVKEFNARMIVAETIFYDMPKMRGMSQEKVTEYAENITNDLILSHPDPKAKILNSRALNDDNIMGHRKALMTRNTGVWQAQALFNPENIIKNTNLARLGIEEIGNLISELHNSLGIALDPVFTQAYNEAINIGDKSPYINAIKATIQEYLVSTSDEFDKIVFEDAVNLDFKDNKTPLESLFPSLIRTKTNDLSGNTEPFAQELLESPLFSYAQNIYTREVNEIKKISSKRKIKTSKKSNK